jgi:zinc protease
MQQSQRGMAAPITNELKESLDEEANIIPELYYIAKGYKLKIVGAEKVEGNDAIDMEVTTPLGKITHRYYDAKSFLLVKTSKSETVPGGSVTQQEFFNGYQTVNGIKVASEQLIDMGQVKISVKFTDIKVNQGLKATDLK